MAKLFKYVFSTAAVPLILGIPLGILWIRAREDARCSNCKGQLFYIRHGLDNYRETYGSLPVSAVGANGKPLHSWRVLLLPFVDGPKIHKKYDFSQPWNSPHNSQVQLEHFHYSAYSCPSCTRNHAQTNFMALRGKGTLWSEPQSAFDGPTSGVLIVEVPGTVNWMDPADIDIEDAIKTLSTAETKGIFPHRLGTHFIGSTSGTRVIPRDATEAMIRKTLTQRGGDF